MNNIVLLCRVTICNQRTVFCENIIEKEETLSSKSDPEAELNMDENSHFLSYSGKLKSKQQKRNKRIIIQEYITCSG